MIHCDILVIGAGIAGSSIACEIATDAEVCLLERESQPGYHSTGRSAALYTEHYGPPAIRKITSASRAFYENPPDGFCEHPLLTPRGVMVVAKPGEEGRLDEFVEHSKVNHTELQPLAARDILQRVPVLREECVAAGLYEAGARDIDVHGLHQGYLRFFKRRGGKLFCNSDIRALDYRDRRWWAATANGQRFAAPLLIDAAGAWSDEIARLAGVQCIGLTPKRRTAFIIAAPPAHDSHAWPLVLGVHEDWYFKPDAGKLLASPADATPVPPQDIQPEEYDIALAVDRLERMTTLSIDRVERAWAGLRSFVADGVPVVGFDPDREGFFWLAGQGGYGIQTAPALAALAAQLVRSQGLPESVARYGLQESELSPQRLRSSAFAKPRFSL